MPKLIIGFCRVSASQPAPLTFACWILKLCLGFFISCDGARTLQRVCLVSPVALSPPSWTGQVRLRLSPVAPRKTCNLIFAVVFFEKQQQQQRRVKSWNRNMINVYEATKCMRHVRRTNQHIVPWTAHSGPLSLSPCLSLPLTACMLNLIVCLWRHAANVRRKGATTDTTFVPLTQLAMANARVCCLLQHQSDNSDDVHILRWVRIRAQRERNRKGVRCRSWGDYPLLREPNNGRAYWSAWHNCGWRNKRWQQKTKQMRQLKYASHQRAQLEDTLQNWLTYNVNSNLTEAVSLQQSQALHCWEIQFMDTLWFLIFIECRIFI